MRKFTAPLEGTAVTVADRDKCADRVKSGSLQVFATPMMLALMEEATCNACEALLEQGETTVGTKVEITHDKASAVGETITARAVLTAVDGRRLCFTVSATDSAGNTVGGGSIERFVVISEKFMRRVNGE